MDLKEANINVNTSTGVDKGIEPWVRYWARTLDLMLFGIALVAVFALVSFEQFEKTSDILFSMIVITLWIFVESIMLSVWGTTPGKSFFKITLQKTDGSTIGISEAFLRSFRVAWRGLAVGIPLLSFLTLLRACDRLSQEGSTSWDLDGGFNVVRQRIGRLRVVLAVIVFVALFGLHFLDLVI